MPMILRWELFIFTISIVIVTIDRNNQLCHVCQVDDHPEANYSESIQAEELALDFVHFGNPMQFPTVGWITLHQNRRNSMESSVC
jgi:hypothetical protein